VADLPSGTLTFLFTDLEGSTRLWEEHPDAMSSALARHDDILREAIVAANGQVVKSTGDGVHAAFASADAAVRAAHDAQVVLDEERWSGTPPLRVRMGVHTGLAELRDGDYFGTTVNRAARLTAVAHGGQIVTSLATAELVRDDLPDGWGLEYLGEHRLPDLGRAERVFQLTAPDLDREFPALRSLDAYPGNLGSQLTSLVGRERELEALATAMRASRLVTLTGVGGVGKTRLAMHVAAVVVRRFIDGAWFCELAAASDDETLLQVVAAALGVSPHPSTTLEGSILEFLRSKRMLLVLDNCEHLIDAAGQFAERVLHACPGVRMLATSREGLGVEGERIVAVRSLSLPNPSSTESEIAASESVNLFVERARAVREDFVVDAANAGAVAEICRRLDGIPLAIELAAARVVAMTPAEIAGLLDERFRLLTGGRRTAVERHQTLRRTVDWSYSLLEPHERLVFDRLGVFAGSFDAAAAGTVVTGDGIETWDVVDALAGLVAKSMVIADESGVDTTRYHVLETLRQYARERLDEADDADRWRRRHAEHFAAYAERVGPHLSGPDDWVWRRHVRTELDNLRSAVTWALDAGDEADAVFALRIVAALVNEVSLDRAAGIGAWAERSLPYIDGAPAALRAPVLAGAGMKAFMRGDFGRANDLAERALAEDLPANAPGVMLAYVTRAVVALSAGEHERAFAIVDEGRRALAATDGATGVVDSMLHAFAAIAHNVAGDPDAARTEAEAAVRVARELRHSSALATALSALGQSLVRTSPEEALAALEESQALVRSGATDVMFANTLVHIARLRARTGDIPGALAALRDAVAHAYDVGDQVNLAGLFNHGVEILFGLGFAEPAAVLVGVVQGKGYPHLAGPELAEWELLVTRVRDALGKKLFADAAARGAAMSLDEADAFVVATLDELLEP
jgi:predicted ATPase/class 3 adenylate cyclase